MVDLWLGAIYQRNCFGVGKDSILVRETLGYIGFQISSHSLAYLSRRQGDMGSCDDSDNVDSESGNSYVDDRYDDNNANLDCNNALDVILTRIIIIIF